MPLRALGLPIVSISDHLHEVGTNAFVTTANPAVFSLQRFSELLQQSLENRPFVPGPRIWLVHWAPSRGAAQRILGRPEDDDGACGTPPAELIPAGAVPEYGSIFAVLRSSGASPRASGFRTAQDGKRIYRSIETPRVGFYFRGPGDDDNEPPFGISVLLFRPKDE